VKRVVVLGCGPAGLLAAHAASLSGADVQIFSRRQKSVISGAQYLHRSVPGLLFKPDGMVTFTKTGERDCYAKKVYGTSNIPVSWDIFEAYTSRPAWSMQKSYDLLWKMYEDAIRDYEIVQPNDVHDIVQNVNADLYITSIPLPAICEDGHFFESVDMWIAQGFWPEMVVIPENTVIYNGHRGVAWHRASSLFGHQSMEFGRQPVVIPDGVNVIHGVKPTAHNCDCHPNWMRVGRFGQWKRGVLVHHAYEEVERALQQMQ
jgi:hypothetical protein